jgi:hypothetical protein
VPRRYELDRRDFDGPTEATLLDKWHADDGIDLCLWISNKQRAPGATAYNIAVQCTFTMPSPSAPTVDTADSSLVQLISYLEPGRTLRIRLGRVARNIGIAGTIDRVGYLDMHRRDLALAYGNTGFAWDGATLHTWRGAFDDRWKAFANANDNDNDND